MKKRNILFDLDGTLLRDDMTISPYTKDVAAEAAKRLRIVVATGRMFDSAREKARLLGLGDVPVICYTGAWTGLAESGRVLEREGLSTELSAAILEEGRKHGWLVQSYINDEVCLPEPSEKEQQSQKYRTKKPVYLGEAFYHPSVPPTRLIIVEPNQEKKEAIRRYLTDHFGGEAEMVYPGDVFLDVHKKGVSKGRTLARLGSEWGIRPEEMVSFGNTENDASMLRLTGLSYAVANAEPEAKAAARVILPRTNNEDAVAHQLAALLGLE